MQELIGRTLAGKYTLERFIGEGGLGRVYYATQPPLGRPVAIKLLQPELCCDASLRARFEREAQAASRITHPNAVAIYDFGCEPLGSIPQLYLVMEWLEGETLHDRIQGFPGRRLPSWEAVRLVSQVLRPLAAFHQAGVIHRDLKPDNVMLCPSPPGEQVKLLDFGIAKVVGSSLTATGQMVGTPHYMAPEQILARKDISPAADLYTVGALLYEALSGDPPYLHENRMDLFRAHLKATPPTLVSRFPQEPFLAPLDGVIQKAMSKTPKDRYPTADAMREAMEAALVASMAQQDQLKVSWEITPVLGATPFQESPPSNPPREDDTAPLLWELENGPTEDALPRWEPPDSLSSPSTHKMPPLGVEEMAPPRPSPPPTFCRVMIAVEEAPCPPAGATQSHPPTLELARPKRYPVERSTQTSWWQWVGGWLRARLL